MTEDKAKELGRLIGQSAEYKAVKATSEALNADSAAVAALQAIEQLREQAQRGMERGERPTPEMEQEMERLFTTVQGSVAYQRAIAAQENFDKLMLQVNQWISEGIRTGATSSIVLL
ncbi:MAG: YlbF family regulator [Gemmatimonadaceae bacterium]|nr:YlbF family regulator [Gemmatimonadaceae bacterium]